MCRGWTPSHWLHCLAPPTTAHARRNAQLLQLFIDNFETTHRPPAPLTKPEAHTLRRRRGLRQREARRRPSSGSRPGSMNPEAARAGRGGRCEGVAAQVSAHMATPSVSPFTFTAPRG
ncbi:hypothetical protein E2C01_069437 [Portunus trituberculatus]|uniref:Uncharacterized protein n=1 Tax=Portunus trituberculatus TaxID=210409 RepID=A0A5B7HYJ5_PORTR|nr:hypothetical protein [Portunus trituberculatus]